MANYRWHLLTKTVVGANNRQELAKILLRNRGLEEDNDFFYPPHPDKFSLADLGVDKQMVEKSYARLNKARQRKEEIIIFGDYDVDGFVSTALVWENLYYHGWHILPFLPHRLRDGYGLRPEAVHRLKDQYPHLKLLLTVDNGISAFAAVEEAKKLGLDVIVLDHHLRLGKQDLAADAVIHSETVSAGGLAWFWLRHWFRPDLGLAALSTISDVMPLRGVNRSLVKFGLPILANTKRVGLRQLFQQAGVRFPLDTYQVGFIIAPRLNAFGRIAEPMDALRLLCTQKIHRGSELARLANEVNNQRQQMVVSGIEKARRQIGEKPDKILVVADKNYHRGILGLISARLLEAFARPALAIQIGKEVSYGSARSVEGIDITRFLQRLGNLLLEVGGHEKAAGFSLLTKNLARFQKELQRLAKSEIDERLLRLERKIDCRVGGDVVDLKLAKLTAAMAPFGEGNPQPLFWWSARVAGVETLGQEHQHLKLQLFDDRVPLEKRRYFKALGFGMGEKAANIMPGDNLDLLFTPKIDTWQQKETLTLYIRDLRLSNKQLTTDN